MKATIEQMLLLTIALLSRLLFFVYALLAWLALPFAAILLAALILAGFATPWGAAGLALVLTLTGWRLQHPTRGSGAAGRAGLLARLTDRFIEWIGTLKYFHSPLCLVEDPGSYRIRGTDIRQLLDGGLLQPGDILLRGYRGYLDGELIRRTGGADGAGIHFSHAALYVGRLDESDRKLAASASRVRDGNGGWRPASPAEQDAFRNDPGYFQTGPQMVLHAMAKGVHVEDILTFLRCDYLAVLRLPETVQLDAEASVFKPLIAPGRTEMRAAADLDARLCAGEPIPRGEIVTMARQAGLAHIGASYDYLFEADFNRFSCSEFVYFCYVGVHRYIGLQPKKHSIAGLFARQAVTPPDIFGACADGKLSVAWTNVETGRQ